MSQQSDHKTGMGSKTALRIGGGLAALAIVGVVSGCSSSKTSGSTSNTSSASSSGGTSAGSSASAVAATGSGPFAFGKTYSTGEETITVSTPTKFTPSSSAVGYTSGDDAYYVTVTVGNTSSQPLSVSTLQVTAAVGSAGTKAVNIIDTGTAGLGTGYGAATPFSADVAAGSTTSGEVAYDVPAAQAGKFAVSIINLAAHAEWTGSLS